MKQHQHWSLTIDENKIGWLVLSRDDSKTNTINPEVLTELEDIIDNLPSQLKALIIESGKPSGILGADVTYFKTFTSVKEASHFINQGQAVFKKIAQLNIVTIALIKGKWLGGGAELALSCRYRIAEQNSFIGLPEIKLGIHPGWGGCVRLPRLIGLKAFELILTGKMLNAKAAKKIGWLDEASPNRLLYQTAIFYALNSPTRKTHFLNHFNNISWLRKLWGNIFIHKLKQKIKPQHYPAPFKVIDNWVKYGHQDDEAFKIEADSLSELALTDTAKNLLKIFFLQESLKKQAKSNKFDIKHVHVIGAGVMGGDIAAWCALKGFLVTLQDKTESLLGQAMKRAYLGAQKQSYEKHLIQEVMDRLIPDAKGDGILHADVVIEAVTEKLEIKQNVFEEVELKSQAQTIIATNTSTIPLEEIGSVLKEPQRLVGIHFFNPVAKMPLVEIVYGELTKTDVIDKALAFSHAIEKLPIPVKSSPGFLVNRILLPYLLEAIILAEEGIAFEVIDEAALNFGMPMGPIELGDMVGLDICHAALIKLGEKVPAILQKKIDKKELGRKTGKGFYQHKKDKTIKKSVNAKEVIPIEIEQRLILRLLNEAVACWDEKITETKEDLEAGCIFGFGFPPFRGGPLTYIQEYKLSYWIDLLTQFQKIYGERFRPHPGWQNLNL